jgi:hypothetical protein
VDITFFNIYLEDDGEISTTLAQWKISQLSKKTYIPITPTWLGTLEITFHLNYLTVEFKPSLHLYDYSMLSSVLPCQPLLPLKHYDYTTHRNALLPILAPT